MAVPGRDFPFTVARAAPVSHRTSRAPRLAHGTVRPRGGARAIPVTGALPLGTGNVLGVGDPARLSGLSAQLPVASSISDFATRFAVATAVGVTSSDAATVAPSTRISNASASRAGLRTPASAAMSRR